jgi:hypothetical protein
VAFNRAVVSAEFVVSERVSAALNDNSVRTESLAHLLHNGVVNVQKRYVVNASTERHVQAKVLTFADARFFHVSCAWEEVSVAMERHRHYPVTRVKGFLNAVTMVHVDVYVEHAIVVFEELKDRKNDVVHIAEPAGFLLLGVMQTATPVYRDVGAFVVEFYGCVDTSSRGNLRKLEHPLEAGTVIFSHFKICKRLIGAGLMRVFLEERWRYLLEVGDVLRGVKSRHFCVRGSVRQLKVSGHLRSSSFCGRDRS